MTWVNEKKGLDFYFNFCFFLFFSFFLSPTLSRPPIIPLFCLSFILSSFTPVFVLVLFSFLFFFFFFTSIPQLLSDDAEWRCWATRDGLVSGFHVASWGVGQFRRVSDGLEQHGKCRSVINDQFQRLEKKNFSAFFILPETLSGSSYQSSWRKADF